MFGWHSNFPPALLFFVRVDFLVNQLRPQILILILRVQTSGHNKHKIDLVPVYKLAQSVNMVLGV